jgi:hypothetical protein
MEVLEPAVGSTQDGAEQHAGGQAEEHTDVVGRCRSNEPLAGAKHPRGVLQGVRFGAGRSHRFEEDTVGAHVDEGQRPEGAAGETLGTGAGRERSTPELGAGSLRSSSVTSQDFVKFWGEIFLLLYCLR